MKIKFVTLTSILALASVHALPATEGPAANEENAMETVNNAVVPAEGHGVEESHKDMDSNRALIPIPIVDDLLKLLEGVIDFVIDLLAGRSDPTFISPAIDELIKIILKLLSSAKNADKGALPVPAAVPATQDPVDIMQTFVANMRAGYSGMEAANNDPLKVISALLSLYSEIPAENLPVA